MEWLRINAGHLKREAIGQFNITWPDEDIRRKSTFEFSTCGNFSVIYPLDRKDIYLTDLSHILYIFETETNLKISGPPVIQCLLVKQSVKDSLEFPDSPMRRWAVFVTHSPKSEEQLLAEDKWWENMG